MSAHCNHCGADLVYGTGEDWQIMTCPVCTERAANAALKEALGAAEVRVKELEQQVSAAENAARETTIGGVDDSVRETSGVRVGRPAVPGSVRRDGGGWADVPGPHETAGRDVGSTERLDDPTRPVASAAEGRFPSSVVPVEAGTGTGSGQGRAAPDGSPDSRWPVVPSKHARNREEAVLIAGGPVIWPEPSAPGRVPDLVHVRERMPDRADRKAYLVHALRFFEDVLAYAERLEGELSDRD